MSPGTFSAGAIVSTTTTVNPAVATLPRVSMAVHVTGVAPSGNSAPDAGTHSGTIAPSTASTAVAA